MNLSNPLPSTPLSFHLEKMDTTSGRAGLLSIEQSIHIETPVFMPVGTRGTVKSMTQEDLLEIGYKIILGNSYHLLLRPGVDVLNHFRGLKNFMQWSNAILTDSGGYQAFSLGNLAKYTDDGIYFSSHLDGSKYLFSPENTLDIQHSIGSNIIMPIDDCAPYPAEEKRLASSLKRTHAWLERSKSYWIKKNYHTKQALFGIVQGGTDLKKRKESAEFATHLDLPGYSIGGLSVGEKNEIFLETLQYTCSLLPKEKPRYLMGVGSIPEIIHAVSFGVDMFDCVLPTRNARNGQVFTSTGKKNVRNAIYKKSTLPIDQECSCKVCKNYSLGYIRHLHNVNEILGIYLTTFHNLSFMFTFMQKLRKNILDNTFQSFKKEWLSLHW